MGLFENLLKILNSAGPLLKGAGVTIELALAFIMVGLFGGVFFALVQVYGNRLSRLIVTAFEITFRAIPAIVLLFIFYFGASHFGLKLPAFLAATVAMGLRSAAYQSQIFRGAIQSVPNGQLEAARAIGMSQFEAITSIVLPQAFRISLPSLGNEFVVVLKDTSLVFAIGVTELMREGRYIVAREFGLALLVYIIIAFIYYFLSIVGLRLLGLLEKRFHIPGQLISAASDR